MSLNPQDLKQLGFAYPDNIILMFEGGSKMHGGRLEETADTDEYGLFLEPPEKIVGLDSYEHFVHHTGQGPRGTNGPEDHDVCLYGLRKWAALAAKGNPSVLSFLWAHAHFTSGLWPHIQTQRQLFVARSHIGAFLGYANAQLERLYGERGQKNCNRTYLEAQHGYDTKYAMHIVRLLLEAQELMQSGKITYPNPRAELLVDIRRGRYKRYELLDMAESLEKAALEASTKSCLPPTVDRQAISQLVADVYREFWNVRTA